MRTFALAHLLDRRGVGPATSARLFEVDDIAIDYCRTYHAVHGETARTRESVPAPPG